MSLEKVTLEVQAKRFGLQVVKPPVVISPSGTRYEFSFMASSGSILYAVDIYEDLTDNEVLKTYLKAFDAKATAFVLWTGKAKTAAADRLAKEYSMRILRVEELPGFFESIVLKRQG